MPFCEIDLDVSAASDKPGFGHSIIRLTAKPSASLDEAQGSHYCRVRRHHASDFFLGRFRVWKLAVWLRKGASTGLGW